MALPRLVYALSNGYFCANQRIRCRVLGNVDAIFGDGACFSVLLFFDRSFFLREASIKLCRYSVNGEKYQFKPIILLVGASLLPFGDA